MASVLPEYGVRPERSPNGGVDVWYDMAPLGVGLKFAAWLQLTFLTWIAFVGIGLLLFRDSAHGPISEMATYAGILLTIALPPFVISRMQRFRTGPHRFRIDQSEVVVDPDSPKAKSYARDHIRSWYIEVPVQGGVRAYTPPTVVAGGSGVGGLTAMGAAGIANAGNAAVAAMGQVTQLTQAAAGQIKVAVWFRYGEKPVRLAAGLTQERAHFLFQAVMEALAATAPSERASSLAAAPSAESRE